MSVGVRVGPFRASTGGYRRRRRHRIGVAGAWFIASLLCGNWFGVTAGVWMLWAGAAVLLTAGAVAKVRRVTARRARRRQRQVRQAAAEPLNERMYYSNRR
jgi:hypothetical protein